MKDKAAAAVTGQVGNLAEEIVENLTGERGAKPLTAFMVTATAAARLARLANLSEEEAEIFFRAARQAAEEAAATSPETFRGITVRPANDRSEPLGVALLIALKMIPESLFADGPRPEREKLLELEGSVSAAIRDQAGQPHFVTIRTISERYGRNGWELDVEVGRSN